MIVSVQDNERAIGDRRHVQILYKYYTVSKQMEKYGLL